LDEGPDKVKLKNGITMATGYGVALHRDEFEGENLMKGFLFKKIFFIFRTMQCKALTFKRYKHVLIL
jgi:hypothetical protein